MKSVDIYTDGACSGNPGVGGWGAILFYQGNSKEISGGSLATTNNRMEIMAVIMALKMLKETCAVNIYSDSAYVVNAFTENWVVGWERAGWKKSSGKLLNVELWQELLRLVRQHQVKFNKVKGHSDNEYNNRCDKLARDEVEKILKMN